MPTLGTSKPGREQQVFLRVVCKTNRGDTICNPHCCFEGISESSLQVRPNSEPVDDNLDCVLFVLVEIRGGIQICNNAVDTSPYEALRRELFKQVQVLALALPNDRCKQIDPGVFWQIHDLINHLTD